MKKIPGQRRHWTSYLSEYWLVAWARNEILVTNQHGKVMIKTIDGLHSLFLKLLKLQVHVHEYKLAHIAYFLQKNYQIYTTTSYYRGQSVIIQHNTNFATVHSRVTEGGCSVEYECCLQCHRITQDHPGILGFLDFLRPRITQDV